MEQADFWKQIDSSRRAVNGDALAQIDALREQLATLEAEEIVDFDRIFSEHHDRAYTWDLWGAAYILSGGCSDDGFMDFRGWLISRGEKIFEAALLDADGLVSAVKSNDGECQAEGFLYVAIEAWEAKTGRTSDEFPEHSFVRRQEPEGERWEEGDLDQRLPRLSRKFG